MTLSCVRVLAASGDASLSGSITILALARGLSRLGRTLLIYADENDILDSRLAPDSAALSGLRELLSGDADLCEIIRRDRRSRLHFIPAGVEGEADSVEIEQVLDVLACAYDFVILSVNSAADALGFAPLFDNVLLRDGDPAAHQLFDLFACAHADVQLVEDAAGDAAAA
jgi:Mrp family chromosome partitioning ATPase